MGYYAPRKYVESIDVIPTHLSTQSIILSKIENLNDLNIIIRSLIETEYQKIEYDYLWIGGCKPAVGRTINISYIRK